MYFVVVCGNLSAAYGPCRHFRCSMTAGSRCIATMSALLAEKRLYWDGTTRARWPSSGCSKPSSPPTRSAVRVSARKPWLHAVGALEAQLSRHNTEVARINAESLNTRSAHTSRWHPRRDCAAARRLPRIGGGLDARWPLALCAALDRRRVMSKIDAPLLPCIAATPSRGNASKAYSPRHRCCRSSSSSSTYTLRRNHRWRAGFVKQASRRRFTLIEQPHRQGFSAACNRAIGMHLVIAMW